MVKTWNEMTPQEKYIRGKKIQQRWHNLRTCFKRELNKQQKEKFDRGAKRRRKYLYFDLMSFLLPSEEQSEMSPQIGGVIFKNEDNSSDETSSKQPKQSLVGKSRRRRWSPLKDPF
ncbi:uncharacterized protein LOC142326672 [Lycorma delicatula]|uniref:uncharacterized protein LOC142326672 n=1 Tax=Lycorma delicatula TaxID=130591 RepID=UPI003F51A87F